MKPAIDKILELKKLLQMIPRDEISLVTANLLSKVWNLCCELEAMHGDTINSSNERTNVNKKPHQIQKPSNTIKVLVIDDGDDIQRLLKFMLEKRGYSIIGETNPINGIRAIETNRPHLVILDLLMPEKSGLEVLAEIRNHKNASIKGIKVLIGSFKSFQSDRINALKAGADDFFQKPYNIEELSLRISLLTEGLLVEQQRLAIIDQTIIGELIELGIDDPDFFLGQVQLFNEQSSKHLKEIHTAFEQKNQKCLVAASHSLANSSSVVGAEKVLSHAQNIERSAIKGEMEAAHDLIKLLDIDFKESVGELKKIVKDFESHLKKAS